MKEGQKNILIKNIDRIDFSNALDIMKWDKNLRKLTISEDLLVFTLSVLRGIATIGIKDTQISILRGIDVGVR